MFEWCSQCVQALILAAAVGHGLPKPSVAGPITGARVLCVASRETGGTFNRFAYNPAGYEGLYQLGASKRRAFYAQGFDNLYDPAQQANFAVDELVIDPFAWPTIRSC